MGSKRLSLDGNDGRGNPREDPTDGSAADGETARGEPHTPPTDPIVVCDVISDTDGVGWAGRRRRRIAEGPVKRTPPQRIPLPSPLPPPPPRVCFFTALPG